MHVFWAMGPGPVIALITELVYFPLTPEVLFTTTHMASWLLCTSVNLWFVFIVSAKKQL